MTNQNMMFGNMEKMMGRMFRRADGVVWDMMTGKVGIQTDDGIATLEGEGDDAQVCSNMFDEFGVALPAFAQSTPVADVKVGDIIFRGARGNIAWVIEKNVDKGTFKLMKPSGETAGWTPPKVSMLGFESGVMVLRSLMSMLPGGQSGLANMQSMMMPLLFASGGDIDFDKMMPMMLMSMMGNQGGNAAAGANPMMQMMMPMMMINMMKGDGSKNPMDDIFGNGLKKLGNNGRKVDVDPFANR